MMPQALTRRRALFLAAAVCPGEAAAHMQPFEESCARTDWRRFEARPLFRAANRINAFSTDLLMEQQAS